MTDDEATPPVVDYAKASADLKRYLPLKVATLAWLVAVLGLATYGIAATWSGWWPYSPLNVPNLDEAKPAIYSYFSGMLGAALYAVRGLYWAVGPQRPGIRRFQYDPNFTFWYVGRPLMGAFLGVVSYAVLRAGAGTFGTASTDTAASAAYFVAAFLAGFAVTQVLSWLYGMATRIFSTREARDNSAD